MLSDEEFLRIQALVVQRLIRGFPGPMQDVVAMHWVRANGWTMRSILEALDHLGILHRPDSDDTLDNPGISCR